MAGDPIEPNTYFMTRMKQEYNLNFDIYHHRAVEDLVSLIYKVAQGPQRPTTALNKTLINTFSLPCQQHQ